MNEWGCDSEAEKLNHAASSFSVAFLRFHVYLRPTCLLCAHLPFSKHALNVHVFPGGFAAFNAELRDGGRKQSEHGKVKF